MMNKFQKILSKAHQTLARFEGFNRHYCVMCHRRPLSFLPYKSPKLSKTIMAAMDLVGSDINNFSCPFCRCHDRERHLLLFLKHLGLLEKMKGSNVLHFAPEKKLSEVIAQHNPGTYVKADLFPSDKSIQRVDLLDIPYGANYFDFVICNHVLEHVSDYRLALSEIRRVLKTNGYAILQTPYSRKLTRTFHDPGLADDFSRLIAYGQEDHLRLFGNNIFDEICSCGFISLVARHEDILGELDHVKYGVNPDEPLFLFQCDGR